MPDRDSVINDLNVAKRILCNQQMLTPEICIRIGQAITSALALLKEQEAVEPKKGWFLNNLNIPEEHWFCGKCDEELVGKGKYCANCGQAVKWDV